MPFPLLALLFGAGGAAGTAGAGAGAGAAGAGTAGAGAGAAGAGVGTLGGISSGAAAGLGAGTAGATVAPAAMGAGGSGAAGLMGMLSGFGGGKGAANNPKAAGMLQQMMNSVPATQPPPAPNTTQQIGNRLGNNDPEGAAMAMAQASGGPMSNQVKMEKLIQGLGGPQGLVSMLGRTRSVAKDAPPLPMPMPPQYSLNPFDNRQQGGGGPRLKDFGMRFRRGGM